jgi:hypothetical protein
VDTSRHFRSKAKVCADGAGYRKCVWSTRGAASFQIECPFLPPVYALVVEVVARVSIHLSSPIMRIGLNVMNGPRWGHEIVLATDRAPADNI